jgi:hypothetical protein
VSVTWTCAPAPGDLLTLFVVPVVYTLLDDLTARVRRGRSGGHHAHRVVPAPALAREPEPVAAD